MQLQPYECSQIAQWLFTVLSSPFLPIAAAVVFYGIPDSRFASGARVRVPVQLHFGSDDTVPGFGDAKAQEKLGQRDRHALRHS